MTLYTPLPTSVEYRGREYPLTASFDRVLEAMAFVKRKDFSEAEKEEYITFLLFGNDTPPDWGLVSEAFSLLCPATGKGGAKTFDWEQDAAVIYASFLQTYGIDLFEMQGKLHWLAFLALLQNLPADSAFGRLVAIRTAPIPKPTKHNQEQVKAILRAKAAHQLKMTDEERKAQFDAGLQGVAKMMMQQAGD